MSAHLLMVFLEPGKLFWLSNYVNIVINEKFSSRSRVKHFICCGKFVNLVERFFLFCHHDFGPVLVWFFVTRRRRDSHEELPLLVY